MLKVYDDVGHFHIPRTGGRSLTEEFRKHHGNPVVILPKEYDFGRHCTLAEIDKIYDIDSLDRIICLVRNPYAICVSLYFWVRRCMKNEGAYKQMSSIHPEMEILFDLEFDDYVKWYVKHWNSLKDWIVINNRIPINLEIYRMEDINMETDINKSVHEPYMDYFNTETKNIIKEFDAWAFDRFEYGG